MCVLKFETDDTADTFMGTLLSYDVDEGRSKVTLDFKSISRIMATHKIGTMTVITDQNDQVMEKKVRVQYYDLFSATGVVTLVEDTYRIEVNHG